MSQFFTSGSQCWSFSFSISPSNEYSGLISFRMDWFDLLAVQGTLKSLLQHHSSKASVLRCSAFLIIKLSHPYMTTGKTIALTRWTFVGPCKALGIFPVHSTPVCTCCPHHCYYWPRVTKSVGRNKAHSTKDGLSKHQGSFFLSAVLLRSTKSKP